MSSNDNTAAAPDDSHADPSHSETVELVGAPRARRVSGSVSVSNEGLISGPHRQVASVIGRVDNYRILDQLGSGGMAVVYRAEDERLRRHVALKILHDHIAGRPENRERFEREARAVARLEHPNIMSVYGFSSPSAPVGYIAAELIDGETLRSYVDRRGFRFPEVAAMVCLPLAEALAHAHEQGIIHRDFKPENVMISRTGVPKLMDFGLARLLDHQTLTMTGAVLGSPAHMSPEAIEGEPVDERVDIFAFGTVLYYAVTGRLPFDGRNPAVILNAILTGRYADPAMVNPRVSAPLARIIKRCLESAPEDRYQSATQLALELRAWLRRLGLSETARELRSYFSGEDAYEESLQVRLVASLEALAQDALDSGRTAAALAHCDHLLAIQEDDPTALAILGRVERRRRARSGLLVALGLLAVVAIIAGVFGIEGRGGRDPGADALAAGSAAGDWAGAEVATRAVDAARWIGSEHVIGLASSALGVAVESAEVQAGGAGAGAHVAGEAEAIAFAVAAANAARITDRLELTAAQRDAIRREQEATRRDGEEPVSSDDVPDGSGDVATASTVRVDLRVRPQVTMVTIDGVERGIAVDIERTGIELPVGRHDVDLNIPRLQGGRLHTTIDVTEDGPREFDFRVDWPPAVVTFQSRERGIVVFEGQAYYTDQRLIVPILEDSPDREIELMFLPPSGEPSRTVVRVRTEQETRVQAPF